MTDNTVSPGLLRRLRDEFAVLQSCGQGDPFQLADAAVRIVGREIAELDRMHRERQEQIADHARQLLALVDEPGPVPTAPGDVAV